MITLFEKWVCPYLAIVISLLSGAVVFYFCTIPVFVMSLIPIAYLIWNSVDDILTGGYLVDIQSNVVLKLMMETGQLQTGITSVDNSYYIIDGLRVNSEDRFFKVSNGVKIYINKSGTVSYIFGLGYFVHFIRKGGYLAQSTTLSEPYSYFSPLFK